MKAAIIKGPHKMEIVDRPIPTPLDNEVLVKIKAVGICGSDVHGFLGLSGKRRLPGLIMGHEASGIVESIGPCVKNFIKGERVTIDPQVVCGTCYPCRRGWANLCDNMSVIGSSMRNFKDGAMCEYIVLKESQLYKIPDSLSYSHAAMLDPASNALHIFNRAALDIGDSVAIIGAGVIGLICVQVAKIRGAGKIIVADISDAKLELAKKFGADILINSSKQDITESVLKETGQRGADVVVEAVGLSSTYLDAVKSVRKRGQVMALGFKDEYIQVPSQTLLFREITITGNTDFVFEIEPFIELASKGVLDMGSLITHTFTLDEVQAAFQTAADPSSGAIKVMIEL